MKVIDKHFRIFYIIFEMVFYIITKNENLEEFLMEDSRGYRWTKNVFQAMNFKDLISAARWLKNMIEGWNNHLGLTHENTKIRKITINFSEVENG